VCSSDLRLAQALLKCGRDKIWLNPEMKKQIAEVKTREEIRGLIASGVIKRKLLERHERPIPNKRAKNGYLKTLKRYQSDLDLKANLNNPNNPKFSEEYQQELIWKEKRRVKKEAYFARKAALNLPYSPRYGNKMPWYLEKMVVTAPTTE